MKKSWMICFISVFLWLVVAPQSQAQFDNNELMPPAPVPDNGVNSNSLGAGGLGKTSGGGNGILSQGKKEKIAQASIDEITDKNYPELIDSFDFNNAEITDVIKAIGELTGKNFIIDPSVRGKITIIAPTKITVAEAYKAFLSALAINGFTVVPSGGFYKIKGSRASQKDNLETYSGEYFPNSDQMITRIIHLKYISAEQINRELRIFTSKDGDLQAFTSTNSLIIADYGSNIERIMKVINQLDVPGFEEKLVVLQVKNAKAKDMAELINKIVNKDSGSSRGSSGGGSFSAGVPRFGGGSRSGQSQSGSAYFMVIPDDRTNSLIVVGNIQGVERVKKLVSQLDFRIRADENGGVHVYYVKNGEAEKIATTLSGIAKDSKPSSSGSSSSGGGAPPAVTGSLFGGDVKITADKDTNSLIITASKSDYDVVLDLLAKIDIPRDQVFVEAVILEMLLEDEGKWGIGYYKFDAASKGLARQGFMPDSNLINLAMSPTAGTGAILSFGDPKNTFEMMTPAGPQIISSMVGLLNFLKGTGRTNVLSTPQIMALDNEESEIEVGEEVAVGLSQTVSNGISQQTPQFKDATIKLKIKPFISPASDSIRMNISQNISQPEQKAGLANTVTLSKRSVTTNIVVPDGDTAVLGGLVKDSEQEAINKIPILGDIPILGWLFKSRSILKKKTNLLIFITPKIIRSLGDNHKLVDKKLNERLNFIKQTGGRDPYGRVIDNLPRQAKRLKSPKRDSEVGKTKPSQDEPPSDENTEGRGESQGKENGESEEVGGASNELSTESAQAPQLSPEEADGRVVE